MGLTGDVRDVVDFVCGYGTFAIPAAKRIRDILHGFDIEPGMIEECTRRAQQEDIHNVRFYLRDFRGEGTGPEPESVDYVMLFNNGAVSLKTLRDVIVHFPSLTTH